LKEEKEVIWGAVEVLGELNAQMTEEIYKCCWWV
jgi:hypothetical protein